MNEQNIQPAAPIIPVYDEDNLPDEIFYPEGLNDPNGPNADALRATAIGEIIEPEAECASRVLQAKAYDVLPEELDTAETEMPDTQEASVPLWDVLPEELDTAETETPDSQEASVPLWDVLPEEEDSSEQTTGWTPREGAKLEVEYLD